MSETEPDKTPELPPEEAVPTGGSTIHSDGSQAVTAVLQRTPSWSDLFMGILLHPFDTFRELDRLASDEHLIPDLTTKAFNMVFLAAMIVGGVRIQTDDGFMSVMRILSTLTNCMMLWVILSMAMSSLSRVMNAQPVSWKKSLVLTGWAFAPVIFFAPVLCFKNAIGPAVILFATVPTWWTMFLIYAGYKTGLNVTNTKLMVIAMVLPPMLFLVYIFWIGLAFFMVISEIVSAFSR